MGVTITCDQNGEATYTAGYRGKSDVMGVAPGDLIYVTENGSPCGTLGIFDRSGGGGVEIGCAERDSGGREQSLSTTPPPLLIGAAVTTGSPQQFTVSLNAHINRHVVSELPYALQTQTSDNGDLVTPSPLGSHDHHVSVTVGQAAL